ncbi:hypothetical protein GHK86_03315 [Acidimicrobiaceae bacterium USS-CC1]|uniref:B3/B4 tRNA-binding domain-containing protein n=1 Tax=Acidiferrimicrobium australe TaxID=2664430 RepID=A0ABW9QPL1_9ACTN|nr:hypothetical protein [Acidiferrimicrobium australe]
MAEGGRGETFLARCSVDAGVFALRPDYRVVLVAAEGLVGGPTDETSDALLREAERTAQVLLADRPPEALASVAAWRDAYRAFGAKPQRTRNSLEALLRRVASGLPRVNRLTDLYNAISVRHLLPLGGEDLDRYAGPARLALASGDEPFETVTSGDVRFEHPEPGEVVWCDDEGVTCRRWNWRQTHRTRLGEDTTAALFVLEALDPMPDEALAAAAADLVDHLNAYAPQAGVARRLITAPSRGARRC